MKHDIEKRFAPGEEQKSGPGAIIGTCHRCHRRGVGRTDECLCLACELHPAEDDMNGLCAACDAEGTEDA